MHRPPGKPIYKTVVVIWLTLSVGSVVLAAITWTDLTKKLESIREAVLVRDELDTILALLLSAEASQHGFIITGDERFLDPLRSAETNLPSHFRQLTEIARPNPAMLNRVSGLRDQSERCLALQREVTEIRRSRGQAAAMEAVAIGDGKRIMDDVRARFDDLLGLYPNLAFGDRSGAQTQWVRASLTGLVAGILGVGAGGYAFWLAQVMMMQQRRERALVEARLRAEHRNREKTVLLANMSHEIRTPMNAILGFSELLADNLTEPRPRRYLDAIRTSATALLQMIEDMLDLSKIEAGVMELRLEPTDPRQVCTFVQTLFSESCARKDLRFECNYDDNLPRALLLDRVRWRQVLVNLVGNAVKFTDRGRVEIRMRCESPSAGRSVPVLVEVEDTGVGIPEDRLDVIFKPFVQAGVHQDRERAGTGLGLSIVKRLTEAMGGTVEAVSRPGTGALFRLRFPEVSIAEDPPVDDEPAAGRVLTPMPASLPATLSGPEPLPADGETRAEPSGDSPRRVDGESRLMDDAGSSACLLVVDDQAANRQWVREALGGLGFQILEAPDGVRALDTLKSRQPDLVLLDLMMPGLDGCDVCRRMKDHPDWREVPVIFLSASDDKDRVVEALESGGVDYVTKPFHRAELVTRVRTQLALKRARDRLKQLARDKEELLGILAHDLKNHLGGVVMSAEILRDRVAARDPADSGAARLVGNIAETSSQLLRFLKEFLANAAVDHETSVRWTTVDLAEAVNAAVARCRTAAECKGILVRESIPEGRVEVRADLTGVGQVLDNVLSNALKFSPPVQSVVVSLVSEADGGVVTVRDQGPGFTEEDRARLFGRYTRLSARPTAGEPSTGLGLSIVRKLMLAMGGEVRCENHPDGGAMVTLRFSRPPDP